MIKIAYDFYLEGVAASYGETEGEAIVINEDENIPDITGKIVVIKYASTDIADRIIEAKGIISETGGISCHLAIVAREAQIPLLIQVEDATEKIKNRSKIKISANENGGKIWEIKECGI